MYPQKAGRRYTIGVLFHVAHGRKVCVLGGASLEQSQYK